MCGENGRAPEPHIVRRGSSPRVRGKPNGEMRTGWLVWLIPACAGKTGDPGVAFGLPPAHPRVCGENRLPRRTLSPTSGSSPRVRGKLTRAQNFRYASGLIPACAGKTSVPPSSRRRPPAHPRVCGENRSGQAGAIDPGGSSPRVRGKRFLRVFSFGPCLAHPRVCGENGEDLLRDARARGSSPRVRGKPTVDGAHRAQEGLIPACAGKTASTVG